MTNKEFNFYTIDSVEKAIEKTGRKLADFSSLPESIRDRHQAIDEMEIIIEAINNGWIPSWSNSVPKYRPWFWMSPSGFACHFLNYTFVSACAGSGSRFHLETLEKSNFVGANPAFLAIWKRIQLG